MQTKWLLKYLDASDSTWGKILDCWFARTTLGRAAVLSSIPTKQLIPSMRGNLALPTFWRQALAALRELPLTLTGLSPDGALSQPIPTWDNLRFPPPSISKLHRDRWERLHVTVLHNLYSDREGKIPFTQDDNGKYIDTECDHHYFQNKKINNECFLNSWEVIGKHTKEHIQPFPASGQSKEAKNKRARARGTGLSSYNNKREIYSLCIYNPGRNFFCA
jgi:predicted DNA-binding WGR domain protein